MGKESAVPRVALVTYDPRPQPSKDADLPVLVAALREAAEADAVFWDDGDVDWGGYDLAVIRSTWDYSWRADEFVAWARRCGKVTRLANPAEVVRWNTDKRYLGELAEAGVPVVPTRYLAPGDPVSLPEGQEYVVKPTSGAGARYAARYAPGPGQHKTAVRHLERMHAEGLTAMVQPYMRGIDAGGERALQFFGRSSCTPAVSGPSSVLTRPSTRTRSPTRALSRGRRPRPNARSPSAPWPPCRTRRSCCTRAWTSSTGTTGSRG